MGQTTPNISIYVPSAGETNYDASFLAGMINVDQHDHSGGPNKGVPLSSSGLAAGAVTYDKLNADVADNTTGIGTAGSLGANQLSMLGFLKNAYQLSVVPSAGFVGMNGSTATARTFQNTTYITWTNPDGVSGNPSAALNTGALFPVTVANGGTGLSTLSTYSVICGGTTATGNVQQVSGQGTSNQVLTSNGPSALPTWQPQNFQVATLTLNASEFTNLSGTPIEIVPAQGSGKVIIPNTLYAKLTYGGSAAFGGGSLVRPYYGGSTYAFFSFLVGQFLDASSKYYYADDNRNSSTIGSVSLATWDNQNLEISVSGANFTGGSGNTVTFYLSYSVMSI